MKTALVLFGQPRFFEITHHVFFKNLIESLEADVFFHSWWDESMIGSIYPCAPHAKATLYDEDMTITSDIPDKLLSIYNPKAFKFDSYNYLELKNRKSNYYQYYTQYKAGKLLEDYSNFNKVNYNLVIRSRFDLCCTQDIEFTLDDAVWFPTCCPYPDRVNDMFSISNQDNFLKLSRVYINLPEFELEGKGEMEWALMKQIQKENLIIKKFAARYETFDILRSTTKGKYIE